MIFNALGSGKTATIHIILSLFNFKKGACLKRIPMFPMLGEVSLVMPLIPFAE